MSKNVKMCQTMSKMILQTMSKNVKQYYPEHKNYEKTTTPFPMFMVTYVWAGPIVAVVAVVVVVVVVVAVVSSSNSRSSGSSSSSSCSSSSRSSRSRRHRSRRLSRSLVLASEEQQQQHQ